MIQGQITTNNNNRNKNIIGTHIPNQKKNQESVNKVLTFFQNLNKATGTTINLEKTTVLPTNTENTEQLQKNNPKNNN